MTKRYTILQKKLKELESQLENIFSLPADPPKLHQLLSDDFEQRLVFVKSLLSAEIASHPSKPHHLTHMSRTLDRIDSAFRHWDATSAAALHHHADDSASTCSCTDSCLNDDGEVVVGDDDGGAMVEYSNCLFDEEEEENRGDNQEDRVMVMEFSNCLFEKEEEKAEKGQGKTVMVEIDGEVVKEKAAGTAGGPCWALASGVLLGMGLMGLGLVMLSSCGFQFGGDETFLTPT